MTNNDEKAHTYDFWEGCEKTVPGTDVGAYSKTMKVNKMIL